MENYLKMEVLKIGILNNCLRMEFFKKIKFEDWNFGKLFENETIDNYIWKLEFLRIIWEFKFENWNFGKLFENESFEN